MVMVPEDLALAMVSLDWAKVVVARVVATAKAKKCFLIAFSI
jgi:hypothetical protein